MPVPEEVKYRRAQYIDVPDIANFTDFWLKGKAKQDGFTLAGNDYFVPIGRHRDFIRKYIVYLATTGGAIIGWSVVTNKGVLIHLLIASTCRGQGIGKQLVRLSNPILIRSKTDQSTGNPDQFYKKIGYSKTEDRLIGKKKNISILSKECK